MSERAKAERDFEDLKNAVRRYLREWNTITDPIMRATARKKMQDVIDRIDAPGALKAALKSKESIPAPFEFDVEEMSFVKDAALIARMYTFHDFPCLDGEDPTEDAFNSQQVATGQMFVRAVNAHEDLVRACKEATLVISDIAKAFGQNAMTGTCLPLLLAAIAKAEA